MSPFPLFLGQLDSRPDDVTGELIEAVEAREIAAIRDAKKIESSTGPERGFVAVKDKAGRASANENV